MSSYLDRIRTRGLVTPSPIPRTLGGALVSAAWSGFGVAVMLRPDLTPNQLLAFHAANAALGAAGVAVPDLPLVPRLRPLGAGAAIREMLRVTPTPTPAPSVDRDSAPAPEPPQRDATHRPDGRRRWPTRPR